MDILDPEKMRNANWWTYEKLPVGTQTVIGETIAKHVEEPNFTSSRTMKR